MLIKIYMVGALARNAFDLLQSSMNICFFYYPIIQIICERWRFDLLMNKYDHFE